MSCLWEGRSEGGRRELGCGASRFTQRLQAVLALARSLHSQQHSTDCQQQCQQLSERQPHTQQHQQYEQRQYKRVVAAWVHHGWSWWHFPQ